MTTLADLRTAAQTHLGDLTNAVWTTAEIDEFINAAIRDISIHFPRVIVDDITTTLNTREYDLNANLMTVISVEYPDGEDPKEFLSRRAYTHPRFWIDEGYYDIRKTHDADATNPPQLYISSKPPAGETIQVLYNAEHNALTAPTDVTTILDRHTHLIALFCRWKGWAELAISEGADPDPVQLLSAVQEVNAQRAERAYRKSLQEAKQGESESASHRWTMDSHDRIY